MRKRQLSLLSDSGHSIHLRVWQPQAPTQPNGAVLLAHGLGEHAGRYEHVADHFTQHGFTVYGPDFVGFGRSDGRRGHAPGGVETYAADLQRVAEVASSDLGEEARRIFVGHSMGGLVVLRLMLERPHWAQEAIICGPAIDSGRGTNLLRQGMARLLGKALPFLTIDHGYDARDICSDPQVVSEYVNDPLVHRRISTGLGVSILDEGQRVRRAAPRFNPGASLLLLQGGRDKIGIPEATRSFGERVACQHKRVAVFPQMKHEVFNEVEKQQVFEAVDRFLQLGTE